MTTILRMLFFRGRRFSGELSGIRFPVRLSDLTASRRGPALLTAMLQYGGHLPEGVRVRAIRDEAADIRDGVKGDKGVITVEYDTSAAKVGGLPLPPSRLFLKFNVGKLGAMRLLVETSECAECECLFYRHLAGRLPSPVRVPTCFFADYSKLSGDFVLVSEAVRFGEGDVAPLKHRVRDDANLDEQKAFAVHGGTLNATYWAQPMATNSVEQAAGPQARRSTRAARRRCRALRRHTVACGSSPRPSPSSPASSTPRGARSRGAPASTTSS